MLAGTALIAVICCWNVARGVAGVQKLAEDRGSEMIPDAILPPDVCDGCAAKHNTATSMYHMELGIGVALDAAIQVPLPASKSKFLKEFFVKYCLLRVHPFTYKNLSFCNFVSSLCLRPCVWLAGWLAGWLGVCVCVCVCVCVLLLQAAG
jgi:hypothetical protein